MSHAAPSAEPCAQYSARQDRALSPAGSELRISIEQALAPPMDGTSEMLDRVSRALTKGLQSEGVLVSANTFGRLRELLALIPRAVPLSAVVVESERTIGLDWQEGRRRILTLTVDERSSLGFAALFANEPLHGRVLTRYITDEDHIDWKRKEAKWRAFRPKPIDHDLSIARINDLDELGIWGLGHELAEQPSGRTVYGRADFYSPDVLAPCARGQGARRPIITVLAVLPMVASLALVLKQKHSD